MNYLLVVDDSSMDRRLACSFLERHLCFSIECASNGWEAMEQIEAQLPLAVITDLRMPEMDGLQLTAEIRKRFPMVPVILMTAFGSEEIASEALAAGAADYVPKAKMSTELVRAVESVLAVTGGSSNGHRLSDHLRYEHLRYELPNDLRLIPVVVDHLQRTARDLGLVDEGDRIRLAKALVEVLRNAIFHGNLELSVQEIAEANISPAARDAMLARRNVPPYSNRHVVVESRISPEEGRFVVRDEGPGFDTQRVLGAASDRTQLARSERRGLVLIKAFVNEVAFNERGNEITLVVRQRSRPAGIPTTPTSGVENHRESRTLFEIGAVNAGGE